MKYSEYLTGLEEREKYRKARDELALNFALGKAVVRGRIHKGWSQTKLAKEVGTRQANISRIESGLANPTLKLIKKINKALDITISFDHAIAVPQDDALYRSLFPVDTPAIVSNVETVSLPTQRIERIPIDLSKTASTIQ